MAGPFTLIPTEVLQDRNMQQIIDFGLPQTTAAAVLAVETGGAVTAEEVGAVDLCGFQNRTDSILAVAGSSGVTPDIVGKVTCLPQGGTSFIFWVNNAKFTKTGGATCEATIPAVKGFYYVYFDSAGQLQASTVPWDIESNAATPVCTVYWDPVSGMGVLHEERHGALRNRPLHADLHDTIGSTYEYGFDGTFTNTTLSVTQGAIHDEDIDWETDALAQDSCRLWYRDGSGGMTWENGVATPYKATVGGRLQFDNAGTLADLQTGYYVVNRVFVALDTGRAIQVVVGQNEYATLDAARAAPALVTTGMPLSEWKLLYRVIYQNVNDTTPTFVEKIDYRTMIPRPNGAIAHVPAATVSSVPTGSTSATDVQSAIAELSIDKANAGANTDITSLAGLTTPLSLAQGGTAGTTAATARTSLDVYSKAEAAALASGITIHAQVVVATTANITLADAQTIDGQAVSNPMRVLVKDQSAPAENGVYVVTDSGAWVRATDFDAVGVGEVAVGGYVFVDLGVANNGTGWAILTAPATLGVDPLVWTQFNAAPAPTGAAPISVAGGVVSLTGVVAPAQGGTGIGTYAVGDLLVANGATSLAKLPDVAVGNVLLSGGIGVEPAYGKVDLGVHVTGALPVGNGGTGAVDATNARANLGAAASGANSDITSLASLSTPLSVAQGGTGSATGSITGPGALTFAAGGSNQNINLNPSGTGALLTGTFPVLRRVAVPATSTSAGVTGDFALSTTFGYFCVSTNVWRRFAVQNW